MLGKIGDLLGKVAGLVDDIFTSEEEKLQFKAPLFEMQAGVLAEVIKAEQRLLEARVSVIEAESQSDSWLTRSWRPIVMLLFTAMVVISWGAGAVGGDFPQVPEWITLTIQIGLGGYLGGRSVEKTAVGVTKALKSREET